MGLVQPQTPGKERRCRGSGLWKKPSPPAALEEVGNHYPEESGAISEPRKMFNLFNQSFFNFFDFGSLSMSTSWVLSSLPFGKKKLHPFLSQSARYYLMLLVRFIIQEQLVLK